MTDQRRFERTHTDRHIHIVLSDGSQVWAQMINIALGGIGIVYPAPAEIGAKLKLVLPLIYDGKHHDVHVTGIVRHAHLRRGTYYIGIEFDHLGEDESNHINRFIKYKETHRANQSGFVVSYRNKGR